MTSWGERLDGLARRNGIIVAVLLVTVLLASVVQLVGWADGSIRWMYHLNDDWREDEYTMLGSLRAGMAAGRFEMELGAPVYISQVDEETQKHFLGRDYWVMTVEDAAGTVLLFSVTTCDVSFRPTFHMVLGAETEVQLLNSKLSDLDARSAGSVAFFFGASANRGGLYQMYYLGNLSNYKSYGVGVHEACPTTSDFAGMEGALTAIGLSAELATTDSRLVKIRRVLVPNTYFETAAFVDLQALAERWGYGPDYVTIRDHPQFKYSD